MEIDVQKGLLAANERLAQENRSLFARSGLFVVNIMSGPGAGKTTLLERTCETLAARLNIAVIEGDLQTSEDAERIAAKGVHAVQINTGGGCHLDAKMVQGALKSFDLDALDLLIIENVGNLVCPAAFDLGESARVMLLSTPEGDEKPIKYPLMFTRSQLLIINKMDLLDYVDFDVKRVEGYAKKINPGIEIITVSAKTGEGMEGWYGWLTGKLEKKS